MLLVNSSFLPLYLLKLKTIKMKHLFLLCQFIFAMTISFAQIKAVTSDGNEVVLNADGTWKYLDTKVQNENSIDTNKLVFTKSASSSFVVKSTKLNCGIYIDPKKWIFKKSTSNEDAEFEFALKGKDAFGMLITEKTEIPLESFAEIALENAKSVAPDTKIVKQEYRKVNNQMVLLVQMNGSTKGIKFTYYGYYFSSPAGSVQLIAYTATNLFNANKNEIEQFLNGFVGIIN